MPLGDLEFEVSRTYCPLFNLKTGRDLMVTWKPDVNYSEKGIRKSEELTVQYYCSLSGKKDCAECSKDEKLIKDLTKKLGLR